MRNNLIAQSQKLKFIIFFSCLLFLSFLFFSVNAVSAVDEVPPATPTTSKGSVSKPVASPTSSKGSIGSSLITPTPTSATSTCNNPTLPDYTTEACVKARLGLSDIVDGDKIFIARDPYSFIVVAFQVLLGILIIIVTGGIVWDAIGIGGAGDDADKRKEKIISIMWRLVGLVAGLGGLGITLIIQTFFFGSTFTDQVIDCNDIPANVPASSDIRTRCAAIIPPTPTP